MTTGTPLWLETVGAWGSLPGDGNAASVKSDAAGLFLGGDAAIGNGWRAGLALGHTEGRVRVDERSSRATVQSNTVAIYGGRSWGAGAASRIHWLAGAAYSRHAIDSRRELSTGEAQTLRADYALHATQLFTELAYALPAGRAGVLEPYAGLAWLNQRSDGFTETGGPGALRSKGVTDRVTTLTMGVRAGTAWSVSGNDIAVRMGLGWRHSHGDRRPLSRMSFAQAGEVAFTVAGAPIARDAALVDLDAQIARGRRGLVGLNYSGQFGRGGVENTGSLRIQWRF